MHENSLLEMYDLFEKGETSLQPSPLKMEKEN